MSAALELETKREAVQPSKSERARISRIDRFFKASTQRTAELVGPDGKSLRLPNSVYTLLRQLVSELAEGNAVTIVPVRHELTTQQAADILNVSRPFLIRQLEAGEIPFRKVGTHRRILFEALMAYKRQRSEERRRFFKESLREAIDLGMDGE
jgi:excisionase family DNA binding protein